MEVKMKIKILAAVALAAALWAADAALDLEAAAECRRFEEDARTYGDVSVPEWCAQVPRP
jgi:hypothetical protein